MEKHPSLAEKMRQLAHSGHARGDELRAKADELDAKVAAAATSDGEGPLRSMLGAWARARRLWCECTGEPLI